MSNTNYNNKPHIYKITNQINGKYYYGVHNGSNTENYMGSGTALRQAIKKHGKEHFSKEILLWFDTVEEAYEYEAVIVTEKLINDPNCYNMKVGGFGGGPKHSEATKQRLSEASINKPKSEQHRKNIKNAKQNISEEHKANLSAALKGKPKSEKTKLKMIETQKKENKPIGTCPHCGKINHMTFGFIRWHFDRCKLNPNKYDPAMIKIHSEIRQMIQI